MDQAIDFFKHLFDTSGFPPRWHCGQWSAFHGWLYIISDLMIWSAYFAIPAIIIKYISRKSNARFLRLYVLFATFILACGATHFLDALMFWVPLYRVGAVVKFITGILSWITVYNLFKYLPVASRLRTVEALEKEIEQRIVAEQEVIRLNERLEELVWKKTQEIIATESRFRSIIENTNEAISLTDEQLAPFYQNPFAEQLTGHSSTNEAGFYWGAGVHPGDTGKLKNVLDEVLASPGRPVPVTFRTLHKEGYYIWAEGNITNMLAHRHVKAIVFNFRDITSRKEIEDKLTESEKIYHSIATNLPNSIVTIIDRNNKFILAEGEGLANLGLTKQMVEGLTEKQGMSEDAYSKVSAYRQKAFSGQTITHEIEIQNINYLLRFVPLKDDNGDVYSVLTISLDITHIKKAETEIKALNETLEKKVTERTTQLELANKELEAFSYSVSHDLRAPLRIINGYADILRMDHATGLDPEAIRLLGIITNNVRQMGILIDELLKLSRLGKKEIVSRSTDMNIMVQEVIDDQMAMNESKVSITVNFLLPAVCDNALMRHVWHNLISNAIKYSSKTAAPSIEISSYTEDGQVLYAVKDNGVGFDMKYSHKLFGVFQRLHKKKDFEGTGVGLALVQRIILKHGGRVWAESEENTGATFYFSLPLKAIHETIQN